MIFQPFTPDVESLPHRQRAPRPRLPRRDFHSPGQLQRLTQDSRRQEDEEGLVRDCSPVRHPGPQSSHSNHHNNHQTSSSQTNSRDSNRAVCAAACRKTV